MNVKELIEKYETVVRINTGFSEKIMKCDSKRLEKFELENELARGFIKELKQISNVEYNRKARIPQFVADWIESSKGLDEDSQEYVEDDASSLLGAMDIDNFGMPNSIEDWLYTDKNDELFAKAWLDGDYEIEEEPKYFVVLPSGQHLTKDSKANEYLFVFDAGQAVELTEDEIKGISKDYQPFAVPVEGVNHE